MKIRLGILGTFFFNAMGCQEAFRTTLLEPFSLKKTKLPRLSHLRILFLTSKKH
ncbi:BDM_1a_G0026020.mRNA.1.CDS.1 [Saccharomyces cerevisiae]|nr:BDM_1a_G0026020.mRNA.1.CDS.1 [Saccharomyces cerevisiae]CAI7089099.1 BDM_1a_G0026020.mRNA.1.CDS.1 [Saccharomyces cerevisiae]